MKITAVVCAYWETRRANARRIVRDLLVGSRVPDRIIVLNNGPSPYVIATSKDAGAESGAFAPVLSASQTKRLVVIEGGHNWECRGKYITALLEPSDYYLLMDDDTSVGPWMVEALERQITLHPEVHVTGYWGVRLQPASFGMTFSGGAIVGSFGQHIEQVDAFHGRYLFASYGAIVNMLALEERVRVTGKWKNGEGDDLLIGLANRGNCYMVPLGGNELPVDLDEGGVAMCHAPGYFEMRDEFLNDALAVMADR